MKGKRLATSVAFLSVVSAIVGACGEPDLRFGLSGFDAGIGGVGPFTSNGASGPGSGAGGVGTDAGDSTPPLARDDAYDLSAETVSSIAAAGVLQNDATNARRS